MDTNPTIPTNLKLRCTDRQYVRQALLDGLSTYTKFLGLAHPRHLALIFARAAFQLNERLLLLHLLNRDALLATDIWFGGERRVWLVW